MFAGTAIRRVHKAAKHDLLLDEIRIFICKEESCRRAFARKMETATEQESSGSSLPDVLARIAREIRNRIVGTLHSWIFACYIMWPYGARHRRQFTR